MTVGEPHTGPLKHGALSVGLLAVSLLGGQVVIMPLPRETRGEAWDGRPYAGSAGPAERGQRWAKAIIRPTSVAGNSDKFGRMEKKGVGGGRLAAMSRERARDGDSGPKRDRGASRPKDWRGRMGVPGVVYDGLIPPRPIAPGGPNGAVGLGSSSACALYGFWWFCD